MAGFINSGRLTDTSLAYRSLTDAAYSTVPPELRKARFLTVRQAVFNLNGKFGCKALSSLKVFNLYLHTPRGAPENRKVYRREPQRNAIFIAPRLFACTQRTLRLDLSVSTFLN